METIDLQLVSNINGYKDYSIISNNNKVGILQTVESDDSDYIFGRQIRIFPEFQRNKIGTQVINYILETNSKPFMFCIATNSEKAINFWRKYLNNKSISKRNIRGEIWQIEKEV